MKPKTLPSDDTRDAAPPDETGVRVLYVWILGFLILLPHLAVAEQPTQEFLWPKGAPGARGESSEDKPVLTFYVPPPELATETAMIVIPGGGYQYLAIDSTGHEVAKWLSSYGVTSVVLEYRTNGGGYQHPAPLEDAQRAIRTVRSQASKLGIKPDRIGVIGFSAGGHLAATAGVSSDLGDAQADDPVEQSSSRPDFMVLCYPVIAFGEPFSHLDSQWALIGREATPELVESLSAEKHVTADTPPTFLFHTDEDIGVPSENSLVFYQALRRAKVPAELHIYQKGGHGVGLARKVPGTSAWPKALVSWLEVKGLLSVPARAPK